MYKIIAILFICFFSITGCATYRDQITAAENIIDELKRSDAERAIEYTKLEQLYNSEREGNTALRKELNDYTESEKRRIDAEREIVKNLEGIFGSGQDIISKLIEGYEEIRKYVLSLEKVE